MVYYGGMKTSFPFSRGRAIASVLTLSVLLSGCKQVGQRVQQKAQDAVTQVQTALLSESDLSGIKDPLVRKNFVAQANAKSYRIVTSSSGKGEGSTTTEIQISGSSVKFHTLMAIGGKSQEMIVIGDTTYVKDPQDGSWWKQVSKPEKSEEKGSTFKAPSIQEIKDEFTKKQNTAEFKQLGTEACGALSCYKYQEVDNGDTGSGRTFWFDNKDYLLRKDEQKFGEFTSTNVYTYDSVNITAPAQAKDVPEGHNVYEYMMGTPLSPESKTQTKVPTQAEIDALMKKAQSDAANADGN